MINAPMSPEEIASVQARIEARVKERNAIAVWSTVSNNENTISRKHVKTLCPNAPLHNAPMKAWRAWVNEEFPDFEKQEAERQERAASESKKRQDEYRRNAEKGYAECGPRWDHNGVSYPHALAFVRGLMSEGWVYEKRRAGVVAFRKDSEGLSLKPMRDGHINSALEYLELTKEA